MHVPYDQLGRPARIAQMVKMAIWLEKTEPYLNPNQPQSNQT